MSTKNVAQDKKWIEISKEAPPYNKEVECRNPECGCHGRGVNLSNNGVELRQILREPNENGEFFQSFLWKVTHWRYLKDSDD
jgi:hypothetical protein